MKKLDLMFKYNQITQGVGAKIGTMSLGIGPIVLTTKLIAMAQMIVCSYHITRNKLIYIQEWKIAIIGNKIRPYLNMINDFNEIRRSDFHEKIP